jgi:isopenicillin N synthase-like dioxygenase
MLDRMTQGLYRSTPHRVVNLSTSNRLSFPFFFDPNFHVEVKPITINEVVVNDDKSDRSYQASVHVRGTYGDYLLNKVSKVFPQLRQTVL